MKDSLIFDLDGTLWDSTKQIKIVWTTIAKQYNIDLNKIPIESIMGLSNSDIIAKFFNNNPSLGNSFLNECQNSENEFLAIHGGNIYPNTIDTIQELSKKYNLYIVSNCQKGYIETFLNFYNLNHYFKDFECSGNTNLPKASNIQLLMARNGIDSSIYIGDAEKDHDAGSGLLGGCQHGDHCLYDLCLRLLFLPL